MGKGASDTTNYGEASRNYGQPSDFSGLNSTEIQRIQFWIDNTDWDQIDPKPEWMEDVEFCLRILLRGKLDDLPQRMAEIESAFADSDDRSTKLVQWGADESPAQRNQYRIDHPSEQPGAGPNSIGSRLVADRYRNPKLVGVGGFGVVFKVDDTKLGIPVAIKILRPSKSSSREVWARFIGEARTTASLSHRSIIRVYDTGILATPILEDPNAEFQIPGSSGLPYLTTQFIDGPSLRKKMEADANCAPRQAAWLIYQVADAVRHAHSKTTLHRDLKPANILLEPALPEESEQLGFRPILTDFGLAKRMNRSEDESQWTEVGTLLGTSKYMSPEQARGDHVAIGTASDVYSLGTILYELMTGRGPFTECGPQQHRDNIQQTIPTRPRSIRKSISSDLEAIVLKSLATDPEDRYAGAYELWADLGRFLANEPVQAERYSWLRKAGYAIRRHPIATSLALLTVLINFVAIFGLAYSLQKQQQALELEQQSLRREQESKSIEKALREQEANARLREQTAMKEVVSLYTDIMDKLIAGRKIHARELAHSLESSTKTLEECTNSNSGSERLLHGLSVLLHYQSILAQNSTSAEKSVEIREKVVAILDRLIELNPDKEVYTYQRFFSRMLIGRYLADFPGRLSSREGRDGVTILDQCLEDIKRLSKKHPDNIDYSDALACICHVLYRISENTDNKRAESLLNESIGISLGNWERFPERPGLIKYAVQGTILKAHSHLVANRLEDAYADGLRGLEWAEKAWGNREDELWVADEYSRFYPTWCEILVANQKWSEAISATKFLQRCTELLLPSSPKDPTATRLHVFGFLWRLRSLEALDRMDEFNSTEQELKQFLASSPVDYVPVAAVEDRIHALFTSNKREEILGLFAK